MKKVLLVEDTKEIFTLVNTCLKSIADTYWAASFTEAKKKIAKTSFDLYLLDIELPDGNGVNLCSEIKNIKPNAPIIFLTSHNVLSEKVLSFSAGADDYITKPFEPLELKARVEARFRNAELNQERATSIKWKELEIDILSQEVKVHNGNAYDPIELTHLEFKLLMYFAIRAHHVISRDTILDDLWGKEVHVYSRSVDTHVSKLRKKLGPAANIVSSIHGAGYKFIPTNI